MCRNDAIGLEWVLCIHSCIKLPCPVLECTTECADPAVLPPSSLSPAGQPPCPPAPLSHESVCSHAPSRRKGRLIVCVCVGVCRGKGALHESSCFIPQSFGLLEYGKKIEGSCYAACHQIWLILSGYPVLEMHLSGIYLDSTLECEQNIQSLIAREGL